MTAAVVLMAYGSPDRLSDVPAYYADIRGGRPIRPELLADLVERYRAMGIGDGDGPSPLNAVTERTRFALEASLGVPVHVGMRHWEPRIAAAVEAALDAKPDVVVGVVLAPHWSSLSIAKYEALFEDTAGGRVATRFVREWGDDPAFVQLLARRVRDRLDENHSHVVFTAHSLPARILDSGDTYAESLGDTARLVAGAAGIGDGWSFAFQSESPTGEPWLGPDILDHLDDLVGRGVESVLVCPVGFVSDHLEIGWDIDVEAAQHAERIGLRLARIDMPNDDPALIGVLAGLVRRALAAVPA